MYLVIPLKLFVHLSICPFVHSFSVYEPALCQTQLALGSKVARQPVVSIGDQPGLVFL